MSGKLFVFIHESNHPNSAQNIASGVILAQRVALPAGKLDLAFGLGGYAIAGCGTVFPHAHGLQNVAVTSDACALKNERAVNAAIGTNNEADLHSLAAGRRR